MKYVVHGTRRLAMGHGHIANIWARQPQTAHGAAALLAQAYPGRFVLGLGVGYPLQAEGTGREFGSPLATMRDYRSRMDGPTWPPAPDVAYPRIIGANGPKMLALAGEIADGALPAGLPPEFTAQARQVLGPDKLLVVGVSVVDADRDRARSTARERVSASLGRPSYAATIARLGYPDQDIAEVSDPLVDAIVGHGDRPRS
ncbi:LLM class flavin-dependent oxidoreductase [Actinacidiphila oryziradicis]|uniref:LLM class flavin-dependent oxidoreductase n=1 Tax=Actinacidiphila oryziradicis TaxID=2571141 RepID=UPI0023F04125|nr:LLM class flavin-dependent oxidoreductase [Actinacidiphila oryziradicis]